ncbi:MAG TPA: apolipoprotein N-acyltransferase [Myxococcales bacterium]|nr:apolipoprotein N-acyltransferase [Myxococcales bacterium]
MKALAGALASAALFGIAARVEGASWVAALLALAPWLLGLERAGARAALASAALLAASVTALAFFWLPPAAAAYAHLPVAQAWIWSLALSPLLLQPQFLATAACLLLARRLAASPAASAAIVGLGYVGGEWAFAKPLADTLGIGLFPSPALRQVAEVAGQGGLTLLCFACSALIAAAVSLRRYAPAAAAVGLVAVAATGGALRLRQVEAKDRAAPAARAGVVQAAITAYDKLAAEQGAYQTVRQILDAHFALSERVLAEGPVDLLVWPETVYPTTFGSPKSEDGAELDREIRAFAARAGVPLVFGAFEDTPAGEHNAAFFLQPDGRFATYRKSLLFPLTERMPRWLEFPAVRAALPWAGRWAPGRGPSVLPLPLRDGSMLRIAPLICYEAVHADYVAEEARAGAGLLLTLSNDAWFTGTAGPRLHLAAAALRSVELRLPQVRATNSGISALILPTGELVSPTAFGARAALRLRFPRLLPSWTPVLAFGDWLGPASAVACALLLAYLFVASRLLAAQPQPGTAGPAR